MNFSHTLVKAINSGRGLIRRHQTKTAGCSVQDTWGNFRKNLTAIPLGALTSAEWSTAESYLNNSDSLEVHDVIEVLGRLKEEAELKRRSVGLPISCLHRSLNLWPETNAEDLTRWKSVRHVWCDVESYIEAGLFERSIVAYGILFSKLHSTPDAPSLAQEIFEKSILPNLSRSFTLSSVIFGSLLQLWATSDLKDAHQSAEKLLLLQKKLYHKTGDENLKPDQHVYANLIHCWLKSGDLSTADRALELLDESKREFQPNAVVYTLVCRAIAHSNRNPEEARSILNEMFYFYARGRDECLPNGLTVASVVESFCRANRAEEAEGLCREMKELSEKFGQDQVRADVAAYTMIMNTWGKQGSPSRAQAIFDSLLGSSCQPDSFALNAVLQAWARSDHPMRSGKVINLLERYRGKPSSGPLSDTVGLNIALNCLLKDRSATNPGQRAETIFATFESSPFEKQWPNEISYQALILILCQSGLETRAKAVIQRLIDDPSSATADISTRHFNALLTGISHHRHISANDANNLLLSMQKLAKRGLRVEPNLNTFNIILNLLSRSRDTGAPEIASDLLDKLLKDSVSKPSLSPNIKSYTAVCHSWASASRPDRAEEVLALMRSRLSPDERSSAPYNAVMVAYSRVSNHSKVREIFDTCVSDLGNRVDFPAFVTLLQSSSKAGEPEATSAILRQILAWHESKRFDDSSPNTKTFNAVLRAWLRSSREDAAYHIEKGIDEMIDLSSKYDCEPDSSSYTILLSQYTSERRSDVGDKAVTILRQLKAKSTSTPDLRFYAEVLCLLFGDRHGYDISLFNEVVHHLSNEQGLRWHSEGLVALNRVLASLSRAGLPDKDIEAERLLAIFTANRVRPDRTTTKFIQRCRSDY